VNGILQPKASVGIKQDYKSASFLKRLVKLAKRNGCFNVKWPGYFDGRFKLIRWIFIWCIFIWWIDYGSCEF